MIDIGATPRAPLHPCVCIADRGNWARVRVDMGTCDELSYDVLINTLYGYSRQYCGLQRVFIGGVNDDWPVPEEEEADVTGGGGDMLGMLQGAAGAGSLGGKRVSMDPMQGPTGLEEELDLLDDLELVDSVEGGSSGGGGSGAAAAAARNERLRQLAGWAEASGRDDVASYSPEDFRRNFPQ